MFRLPNILLKICKNEETNQGKRKQLMSLKVYAEMSPEESTASDYVMIEQNLDLRKRMSVSYFNDIVKEIKPLLL